MPLQPSEMVVLNAPTNVDGTNAFLQQVQDMLGEAGIRFRSATLAEIGDSDKPEWVSEGTIDSAVVIIDRPDYGRALQVIDAAVDCRLCLRCGAYIKQGDTKCPKCGVSDERDGVAERDAYLAAMRRQQKSNNP